MFPHEAPDRHFLPRNMFTEIKFFKPSLYLKRKWLVSTEPRLPLDYYGPSPGPILESKGMRAVFQKKGKILESLGKNVQNLKIF